MLRFVTDRNILSTLISLKEGKLVQGNCIDLEETLALIASRVGSPILDGSVEPIYDNIQYKLNVISTYSQLESRGILVDYNVETIRENVIKAFSLIDFSKLVENTSFVTGLNKPGWVVVLEQLLAIHKMVFPKAEVTNERIGYHGELETQNGKFYDFEEGDFTLIRYEVPGAPIQVVCSSYDEMLKGLNLFNSYQLYGTSRIKFRTDSGVNIWYIQTGGFTINGKTYHNKWYVYDVGSRLISSSEFINGALTRTPVKTLPENWKELANSFLLEQGGICPRHSSDKELLRLYWCYKIHKWIQPFHDISILERVANIIVSDSRASLVGLLKTNKVCKATLRYLEYNHPSIFEAAIAAGESAAVALLNYAWETGLVTDEDVDVGYLEHLESMLPQFETVDDDSNYSSIEE